MSKVAVYTGSFDPITLGHVDIIQSFYGFNFYNKCIFDHDIKPVAGINNYSII